MDQGLHGGLRREAAVGAGNRRGPPASCPPVTGAWEDEAGQRWVSSVPAPASPRSGVLGSGGPRCELGGAGRRPGLYLHLRPLGRGDFGVVHLDLPLGHLVEALQDDAEGLAHLLHAAQVAGGAEGGAQRGCCAGKGAAGRGRGDVPVVAVPSGADGDVELHLVVDVVGLGLAQIPVDPRAPQHHPAAWREAAEQGDRSATPSPRADPAAGGRALHRGDLERGHGLLA